MTRILRFVPWPTRHGASRSTESPARPAEQPVERPEIARGTLTSFRRFRREDASELIQWGRHVDPLLESYNMDLRSPGDAQRWYNIRMSWVDSQLYAVDSLQERRVIGYIGLREINLTLRTSVLGISFDPNATSRGYGFDALATFLKYYFESWRCAVMYLDVAATNFRARRCYERCGFEYTGQHWKPFTGSSRRVMREPVYLEHPEMFRVFGRNLSMLFYDMQITRDMWGRRGRMG